MFMRFVWSISWLGGDVLRDGNHGDEGRVGSGRVGSSRGWMAEVASSRMARGMCDFEAILAMWVEERLLFREKVIRLVQWLDRSHGYKGE